jgi:hypothetical protein
MSEPAGLLAAAQRKRDATLQRAAAALAELADEGAQITFQGVAGRARVSRQWLYGQPELRAQIEELRQRPCHGVPAHQRSSEASLEQRLRGLLADNRALRDEIGALKSELALAYGAQRSPLATAGDPAAAVTSPPGWSR